MRHVIVLHGGKQRQCDDLATDARPEKVLEIFEITGLDSVITVHASQDEAISALTPTG